MQGVASLRAARSAALGIDDSETMLSRELRRRSAEQAHADLIAALLRDGVTAIEVPDDGDRDKGVSPASSSRISVRSAGFVGAGTCLNSIWTSPCC